MFFRHKAILCGLLLLLFACEKREVTNLGPAPEISSFSPEWVVAGEEVALRGSYFGTDKSALEVLLGERVVEIEGELRDTLLQLRVPLDFSVGEVPISLRREGKTTQATSMLRIVEPARPTLIENKTIKLGTFTSAQLSSLLSEVDVSLPGVEKLRFFLRYDVDFYVVNYNTSYKSSPQRASALVSVPRAAPASALLGVCHGTITKNLDAPSVSLASLGTFEPSAVLGDNSRVLNFLYATLASLGYVSVQPDYLGFGESRDVVHPYYYAESLAGDVVDALQAAYALAIKKDISVDGKLYLTGYSQGGHVAMATQRAIEANPRQGLHLQMNVVGAGAYDLEGMLNYLLSQDTFSQPYYLPYLFHAYKSVNAFDILYSTVFKEPYASLIPTLFNKERTGTEINAMLNSDLRQLLADAFRTKALQAPEYAPLIRALKENSLLNWTPKAKLLLYHGKDDTVVPYSNSELTYQRLSARAGEGVVELHELKGDHSSAVVPYAQAFLLAIRAHRTEETTSRRYSSQRISAARP